MKTKTTPAVCFVQFLLKVKVIAICVRSNCEMHAEDISASSGKINLNAAARTLERATTAINQTLPRNLFEDDFFPLISSN